MQGKGSGIRSPKNWGTLAFLLVIIGLLTVVALIGRKQSREAEEHEEAKRRLAQQRAQLRTERTERSLKWHLKQGTTIESARRLAEERADWLAVEDGWLGFRLKSDLGRELFAMFSTSKNELSFKIPFDGGQRGSLKLVRFVDGGEVLLEMSIEKGRFVCGSCTVSVRFDERPIQEYAANTPSDSDPTSLLIRDHRTFIAESKRASAVRIEAAFYQEGYHTLEFSLERFESEWNKALVQRPGMSY